MQIQSIFKAGNSNVVVVPAHLMKEVGLKSGGKVIVEKSQDKDELIIRKATSKKSNKLAAKNEFKKWLDVFMKENAEILDELAVR